MKIFLVREQMWFPAPTYKGSDFLKVIAAVKNKEALQKACSSKVEIVFDIEPNIEQIEEYVKICHENGKTLFVHIDLAEGIGKDKYGLRFLQRLGVDGIISTRTGLIKSAKELGLGTVQRIFVLDSHSIDSIESIIRSQPDMIELMPGVIPAAIKEVSEKISVPVSAGGLIRTADDVKMIMEAGAVAASTSKTELW